MTAWVPPEGVAGDLALVLWGDAMRGEETPVALSHGAWFLEPLPSVEVADAVMRDAWEIVGKLVDGPGGVGAAGAAAMRVREWLDDLSGRLQRE